MKKGKNKILDGVCSGISENFGIKDPIWIRLIFACGGFVLLYVLFMFLMDEA